MALSGNELGATVTVTVTDTTMHTVDGPAVSCAFAMSGCHLGFKLDIFKVRILRGKFWLLA